MRLTSDAEWYRSRCVSQVVVAVRHATSAILFPSREDSPHAQARLAPTTIQQQPLEAREGRDTTLVVKVTVDKATIQGDRVMVDKATTQEDRVMVDKATTQGDRVMVDKATTQEDKVMVDKATTQVDRVVVDKATTQGDRVVVVRDIIPGIKMMGAVAITREDKEMLNKAEEARGIIQEARGISQDLEDRVTTLEGVTPREYLGPGLDSTRTS